MAGGTAGKTAAQVRAAISATSIALGYLQYLAQQGNIASPGRHTEGDPKIAAAVAALQALA